MVTGNIAHSIVPLHRKFFLAAPRAASIAPVENRWSGKKKDQNFGEHSLKMVSLYLQFKTRKNKYEDKENYIDKYLSHAFWVFNILYVPLRACRGASVMVY